MFLNMKLKLNYIFYT